MSNPQDMVTSAQAQALESIRSGQAAAVDAVRAWSQAVAKFTPEIPGAVPVSGFKETLAEPAAIVDSVYDFAAQLLELNKQFVHSVLEAGNSVVEAAEAGGSTSDKPAAKK